MPVLAAAAEAKDMPIIVRGVGSVPVTYLYMKRLSEWLSGSGGRRPSAIALDHALVPAGNYPRPTVIDHQAAD